jgi:hypothetical protein
MSANGMRANELMTIRSQRNSSLWTYDGMRTAKMLKQNDKTQEKHKKSEMKKTPYKTQALASLSTGGLG